MALWFIRAIEHSDGSWTSGWAGVDFGSLPDETTLIAFLVSFVTALGGRHLFEFHLHRRDGRVETRRASHVVPTRTP